MNGYQIGVVIVALGVLLLCVTHLVEALNGVRQSESHKLKVKLLKAINIMTWEQLKEFEKATL